MVTQIVVTFSEVVEFESNDVAGAFSLERSATSTSPGTFGSVSLTANPSSGATDSVTITFSGTYSSYTSLVDGFYNFKIDASKVTGRDGNLDGDGDESPGGNYVVNGNTTNKFFRLYGDSNGSATTDIADWGPFLAAFNMGPNSVFDYEIDGNVGLSDFAQFRARYNLITP